MTRRWLRLFAFITFAFAFMTRCWAQEGGDLDASTGDAQITSAVPGPLPPPEHVSQAGSDLLRWVYQAAHSENWFWLVTVALSALAAALNSKPLLGRFKALQTKNGKRLSLAVTALAASFGVAYGAGKTMSFQVAQVALAHAFAAAFGYDFTRAALGRSSKPLTEPLSDTKPNLPLPPEPPGT